MIMTERQEHTQIVIDQLSSLRAEMSGAMLAISGNSVSMLEESLWNQEILCVSLKNLVHVLQSEHTDRGTLTLIQSTAAALQEVNITYSKVVEQSRAQADVLYNLCLSHAGASFGEITPATRGNTSWKA